MWQALLMSGGIVLAGICVWPAAPVEAQSSEERARRFFEAGVAASDRSDWSEALSQFEAAWALFERPVILYNIAKCLEHLGRVPEAIDHFERFLALAEAADERRQYATDAIQRLGNEPTNLDLVVSPDAARVFVDGVEIDGTGTTRSVALSPGTHAIRIDALGYHTQEIALSALRGETLRRTVTLEPIEDEIGAVPEPSANVRGAPAHAQRLADPSPGGSASRGSPMPWVLVGVGGVGTALSMWRGVIYRQQRNRLEHPDDGQPFDEMEYNRALRNRRLTITGLVLGVSVATAGIVWRLVSRGAPRPRGWWRTDGAVLAF